MGKRSKGDAGLVPPEFDFSRPGEMAVAIGKGELRIAIAVVFAVFVLNAVDSYLTYLGLPVRDSFVTSAMLKLTFSTFTSFIVGAGIMHALARLLGAKGASFVKTLAFLGYAYAALVPVHVLSLVYNVFKLENDVASISLAIVGVCFSALLYYIMFRAFVVHYGMSRARAGVTAGVPFLLSLAVTAFLYVLAAWA
jgi:hypothetical protein